jgi:hypothetical protein
MIFLKKIIYTVSFFPLLMLLFYAGCENNPNDLGITFLNPNDTAGTKILDTTIVTSFNFRNYINNKGSGVRQIGNYAVAGNQYSSKMLIQYGNIPTGYQNANVISANLRLRYAKYAFKDTTGTVSFNVYRLNRAMDVSTITNDSVTAADIGTTVLGTYTGNPTDTSAINIALNTDAIRDWLNYAADSSYAIKNYGLAFVPNSGSTTIKAFFSENNDVLYKPVITVVAQTTTSTDSLKLESMLSVSLTNAPTSIIPASQFFIVQNGVGFRDILKFSFPNLPANVIINEAYLQLTLNSSQSYITSSTNNQIEVDMVTDTTTRAIFDESFNLTRLDSITYTGRINQIVQRWNSGVNPNYGVSLRTPSEIQNLDYLTFYNSDNTDVSKRPKLRIRYTLRQ